MPMAEGESFAGYTVVRLLGVGGMGEVYLARHPRLPRNDALKVLPRSVTGDGEYRARFEREADIAATLWHPNIVAVHDRGEFDGQAGSRWTTSTAPTRRNCCAAIRTACRSAMSRDRHRRRRGPRLRPPASPAAPGRQTRKHPARQAGSRVSSESCWRTWHCPLGG